MTANTIVATEPGFSLAMLLLPLITPEKPPAADGVVLAHT